MLILVVVIWIAVFSLFRRNCFAAWKYSQLLRHDLVLPPDYDPTVSHSDYINGTMDVYVRLFPVAVTSISDYRREFTTEILMSIAWSDERVLLINGEHDNSSSWILSQEISQRLWLPPLYFINCIQCSDDEFATDVNEENPLMFTVQGKTIQLIYSKTLRFRCNLNFAAYPLDEHRCFIRLFLIHLDSRDVGLVRLKATESIKNELLLLQKRFSPYFTLLGVDKSDQCSFQTGWEEQDCLQVSFRFTRRNSAHMARLYIPSSLIVCLAMLSMWVSAKWAVARTVMVTTTVIAIGYLHAAEIQSMPLVGYTRAMDIWILTCQLIVFSILIELVLAFKYRHRTDLNPWKMLVKKLNLHNLFMKGSISPELWHLKRVPPTWSSAFGDVNPVDAVARVLFPTAFFLFNVIYWLYYTLRDPRLQK